MLGLSTPFEQVKNWLISSGLVVIDRKDENCGAVHAYYDIKNKKYGFLYPEITGYHISALRFLYQHEKNEKYLESAKLSSDWLIRIYKKYNGIIMGLDDDKSKQQNAFSFDTAICAKGLLDCFILTRDKKYLESGKELIHWLMKAVNDDGTIKPFKNMISDRFMENNNVWYKQKSCLHIKTAIPILQLYQLTRQNELLDNAIKICNSYTHFQNHDGSFAIHEGSKIVNLHTMCYAMEGLLYAFYVTKNMTYQQCCKKAIDWCVKNIEDDGGINLWFNSKYNSKASYPVAQLIRLMILLDCHENSSDYKNQIDNLHSFLLTLQATENDHKTHGGFFEEYHKSLFGWKKRLKLNSWGSMFALQSLKWHEIYPKLDFQNSIGYLY
jgi:hypothetical protein